MTFHYRTIFWNELFSLVELCLKWYQYYHVPVGYCYEPKREKYNKNNNRGTVTCWQVLELRIGKHCYNLMVSKCKIITCVWHMTRMTLQYFFMVLKSLSITLLPSSSAQRLEALEKAFFLDLHLYVQTSMGTVDETEERMGKPNLISNDMLSGERALCG